MGGMGSFGFFNFISPSGDMSGVINVLVGVAISMVLSFVLTFVIYKDDAVN